MKTSHQEIKDEILERITQLKAEIEIFLKNVVRPDENQVALSDRQTNCENIAEIQLTSKDSISH